MAGLTTGRGMTNLPAVIDASITMAWCFEDESTDKTRAVRDYVRSVGAVVPGHWAIEVQTSLRLGERRRRLSPLDVSTFVQTIWEHPIEIDVRPLGTLGDLLPLARQHGLSISDAAYVELALRRGLPLATKDDQMRQAAQTLGIQLLDTD